MTTRTTYRYNDNWDCEVVAPNANQTISWGSPAEITQAKSDKVCPRCGAVRGEGYINNHGKPIPGGFELIFDETDTFGARCLCNNCGFSF
jgi:hypothetical protein